MFIVLLNRFSVNFFKAINDLPLLEAIDKDEAGQISQTKAFLFRCDFYAAFIPAIN